MSTIVTRANKGSALTYAEADANFTNLNNDKFEASDVGTVLQAYDANLTAFVNTFELPTTDGIIGQVLQTDGNGNIGFVNAGTGSVQSVDMTVPTGLQVLGNPVTTIGTLSITYQTGYSIPTNAKQSEWDTAFSERNQWDGGATGLVAATGRTSLGVTATGADTTYAYRANNLSDLANVATARSNLGVSATGADITYAFRANNLSDLTDVSVARSNIGVTATGADTTYAFRANNLSDLANAATARTNLGLGTVATQDANNLNVTIVGGSISGITDLAVADGGTGSSTADGARVNLNVITSTTGSEKVPAGTTAQRDGSPAAGYFRFNSTLGTFEGYNGTAWGSVGGGATGAAGDEVFIENEVVVTTSYTLSTGKNAMSTGPISLNSGVTVTVPSGARWVVL